MEERVSSRNPAFIFLPSFLSFLSQLLSISGTNLQPSQLTHSRFTTTMSLVGVAVSAHDLDPSLYALNISSGDIDFFRKSIVQSSARTETLPVDSLNNNEHNDDEAIKRHIFDVQAKAFAVHRYDCICRFAFIRPRIATLPGYERALELLKLNDRKESVLLDVGCCCTFKFLFAP